jgi:acetyltransferase-like isoleucine patch superfamily enzyme
MKGKFIFLLKIFGLPLWYNKVPKNVLLVNYIFQRIFRINAEVPFSVNFRNRVRGIQNMELNDVTKFYLAFNSGIYITAFDGTKLIIGEDTLIASNVAIQTGNHGLLKRDVFDLKSVTIGENCWLGFGSVLLPGAVIGNNVTVGANAVVTKSFSDNVVIGGCPAKIIKQIEV